jgi:hypothetical protein
MNVSSAGNIRWMSYSMEKKYSYWLRVLAIAILALISWAFIILFVWVLWMAGGFLWLLGFANAWLYRVFAAPSLS